MKKYLLRISMFLGLAAFITPVVPATSQEPPSNIITATAGPGGTISPSGAVSVNYQANQTFTVTPYTGNSVAQLTVDGVTVSPTNNSYTFTGVTVPHTISVTFNLPANTAPFNILGADWNNISIGTSTPGMTNYPQIPYTNPNTGVTTNLNSTGWQDGIFINGQVLYYPWDTSTDSGPGISQAVQNNIPQSVIVSYNAVQGDGVAGFNNSGNWTWFDLQTLGQTLPGGQWPFVLGNVNAQGVPVASVPEGFTGGTTDGRYVYLTPDGHHQFPVFIKYDSTQSLNSTGAYQVFIPPAQINNGTIGPLGKFYGWCSAVFDGRYVYYVPLNDPTYGNSGNIFRYDTTQPFNNSNGTAWSSFNMTLPDSTGAVVNPNASSFQSASYDGHRFIYFAAFTHSVIVRYDTTLPFNSASSYEPLDTSTLNSTGPAITGQGSVANLSGFTGSAIVWDTAGKNEYLYLVPWAMWNSGIITLESTAVRVRIGTQTSPQEPTTWKYVEYTSATATGASAPNWEMYDISQLELNPAWPASWEQTYTTGSYEGQNALAGWQMTFISPATANSPSMVGFGADTSQYLVEHNVDKDLFDPSGWYLTPPVSLQYQNGTMGGGFDPPNNIMYASSPGSVLYAVKLSLTNTVTITASAGNGGSISPAGAVGVTYGGSQVFSVSAATGSNISSVLVDDVPQTLTYLNQFSYNFQNVIGNHTISATFTPQIYTITATAYGNGSISCPSTADYNTTPACTITPNTGYYISNLTVDGNTIPNPTSNYTFPAVTSNQTIRATFTPSTYTITASTASYDSLGNVLSPGTGGSMNPPGPTVNLTYPNSKTFTMNPKKGYTLQLIVDGTIVPLDGVNTYTFSNVSANHTISANFISSQTIETITATAGTGGTISPSGAVSVDAGNNQTFTVTPNTGYNIGQVMVNGSPVTLAAGNAYTFNDVTTNQTITASFIPQIETITATAGSNGTISPSGVVSVNYGTSQTFTVTPQTGYTPSLTVDGSTVPLVNNSYTLNNVTTAHTVSASFTLQTETLTVSAGSGGSISPTGTINVNYGTSQTFTLTPQAGYTPSLTVDGTAVTLMNDAYTLNDITGAHIVTASFTLQTETITSIAGSNGTISPLGSTTVNYGGSQIYTITPNNGYKISHVIVNGVLLTTTPSSYTFTNVTTNQKIRALFVKS